MSLEEKMLREEYKYKGKIINLRVDDVRLPNGKLAKREIVEHNGGVAVAALTDNDEIYMVRQFRYPYKEVIYEIPAGKRDGDEEPLMCGQRELKEETGMTAETFTLLGEVYPTPGYCEEIIWVYAAKNLSKGNATPDEDEFLEAFKVPLVDAYKMVMDGEIKDAKTQIAILKLYEMHRNGKF